MAEADRANAEAARAARSADMGPATPMPAMPPIPPMTAGIPTLTGGKLVTGTLNGGGPEISVSTMNGDVKLLQLTTKK